MKKPKFTDSSLLGRKLRDRLQQRYPHLEHNGCLAQEADRGYGQPRRWVYTVRRATETYSADSIDEAIDKFAAACAAARLTGKMRPPLKVEDVTTTIRQLQQDAFAMYMGKKIDKIALNELRKYIAP